MSEDKHETVAAVVVTYNRKELLRQCLDGILAQTRPVDAIYLVDNASTDGTEDMIATEYADRVIYERLPQNTGSAGGFHHGMKRGYEDGHDWIWVMDDDVTPLPDCLGRLLEHRAEGDVLLPLRVGADGSIQEVAAVLWQAPRVLGKAQTISVGEVLSSVRSVPPSVRVSTFSFEGPLVPTALLSTIGFPRADFFISCDDWEFALRTLKAGATAACVTNARLVRLLNRSPSKAWRRYYMHRNLLALVMAYDGCALKRLCKPVALTLRWMVGALTRGEFSTEAPLLWHAFRDSRKRPMPKRYLPQQ